VARPRVWFLQVNSPKLLQNAYLEGGRMNRTETLVVGVALGAGIVYFLDPHNGARRRALVRDRIVGTLHDLEDGTVTGARHVRNRAVGLAHEAKAELTERAVDDHVLVERVRSAMGRDISNPGAIEVTAHGGHITLAGDIPSVEVQPLVRTVKSVRGVKTVENRLSVHTDPRNVSSLQGAGRSR
jgi:hypothetical protein